MNPQIVYFTVSTNAEQFHEIADELIQIVEFAPFINMSAVQRNAVISQIRNADTSYDNDISVRLPIDMGKFLGQGLSTFEKAKVLAEHYAKLAANAGTPISITLADWHNNVFYNSKKDEECQPQAPKPERPQHPPIKPAPESNVGIDAVREVFRLRSLISSLKTEIHHSNQDIEALKQEVAKINEIIEDAESRNKKREAEIDEAVKTLFTMGFMLVQ